MDWFFIQGYVNGFYLFSIYEIGDISIGFNMCFYDLRGF